MENQLFTQTEILSNPTTLSWVYILYNTKTQEMNIGLSFNPAKQIGALNTTDKLVYYRSFNAPFDALAHKHLLDSLSKESVMHHIKQVNPSLENLMPEIMNHFNNN